MNNLDSYDDYLNGGLIDDFKSKISSWWNNNWVDEPNPDRDYIAYNRAKEDQEPKPNKFKKFKTKFRNNFKNFVVPGFDVEKPKVMDRE